jgi:menaquinone-dependent protoporphyrinogen oxidase
MEANIMDNKKILVAYATRGETTSDVADAIGLILTQLKETVDVRPVQEVESLTPYKAVILGSAIRNGRWLPEAAQFLEENRKTLAQTPIALFTVCMTMRDDTPEHRMETLHYVEPLLRSLPEIQPVHIGLFAGALDRKSLSWIMRLASMGAGLPQGDYRNWTAIRLWTNEVHALLVSKMDTEPITVPV